MPDVLIVRPGGWNEPRSSAFRHFCQQRQHRVTVSRREREWIELVQCHGQVVRQLQERFRRGTACDWIESQNGEFAKNLVDKVRQTLGCVVLQLGDLYA